MRLTAQTAWLSMPLALLACNGAEPTVSPPARDAAVAADSGNQTPVDQGFAADAGEGVDVGFPADSGVTRDGGSPPTDAGHATDAGQAPPDAGQGPTDTGPAAMDAGPAPCVYPAGAPARPTDGQTIAAYSWSAALDPQGMAVPLQLEAVFCNTDVNHDWSAHDYMLFMSVPEW